jgi:hypothetical protein
MLNASYMDSNGNVFDLATHAVRLLASNDLSGWKWSTDTINNTTTFYRAPTDIGSLQVEFYGDYMIDNAEYLIALCDNDTASGAIGTLTIGDWSLNCNVSAGDFKDSDQGYISYTLTIHADSPVWHRTTAYRFAVQTSVGTSGLNFPHDFPHDLSAPVIGNLTVVNPSLCPSDFLLIIYGPATNPAITISGTTYQVNVTVPSGSILFIDSANKGIKSASIFMRTRDGSIVNEFSTRVRGSLGSGSYIFQPIPVGDMTVSWSGTFGFDLELYEGRGKRPWI